MEVLCYMLNYFPDSMGTPKYNYELVNILLKYKIKSTVITGHPYYPEWKFKGKNSPYKYELEEIQGTQVTRCPTWIPKKVTFLTRILLIGSFVVSSLPILYWSILKKKPEWVIVTLPSALCLIPLLIIKLFTKIKVVAWVHDLEISAAINTKIVNKKSLNSFFLKVERLLFLPADKIFTLTTQMKDYLHKNIGIDDKKIGTLPLWFDVQEFEKLRKKVNFKEKLNFSTNKTICLYSGNIGKKQGLEVIIESAKLLQEEAKDNYLFVICGSGAGKNDLVTMAKNLSNIVFLEPVHSSEVPSLYDAADIHLLPQLKDVASNLFPSKLLTMFASKKPVIAACLKHTALYDAMEEHGYICEPENPIELVKALIEVSNKKEKHALLAQKAYEFLSLEWDEKKIIPKFKNFLETNLNSSSNFK